MGKITLIRDIQAYHHASVHSTWFVVAFPDGQVEGIKLHKISLLNRRYQEFVRGRLKKKTTNPKRAVSVLIVWPGYRPDTSYHLGNFMAKLRQIGLGNHLVGFIDAALDAGWDPEHMERSE